MQMRMIIICNYNVVSPQQTLKAPKMKDTFCEKMILADSLGVRLTYCPECNVVELEIGAISLRLNPDVIQRVANIMMKASLQLDHIEAVKRAMQPNANSSNHSEQGSRLQMAH